VPAAGAQLVGAHSDRGGGRRGVGGGGARPWGAEENLGAEADVFAPCALGGVLNHRAIPRLKAGVVAGAANNQLLEARHGEALERAGILYAPDYVANAGGIINGCIELLGWEPADARRKVEEIYDTLLRIFEIARRDGVPTSEAADRLAEERLRNGIK
jgi:leucine dehydrogenase